jgi:DNA-binding response OmpR family regulator
MTEPHQTRILLAEDDDAMRTYLERALEKAGYAVDSCPSPSTSRISSSKWSAFWKTGFPRRSR